MFAQSEEVWNLQTCLMPIDSIPIICVLLCKYSLFFLEEFLYMYIKLGEKSV